MNEDKSILSDEQVSAELAGLTDWQRDGNYIEKDFRFDSYRDVNRFLPHMGITIAALNHHPDITFASGEKRVSIRVTTHSLGGITKADIDLAKGLEAWRTEKK